MTTRIQNGRVWDGAAFREADVYIENGIIAALGDVPTKAERVFDAAGRIVAPGLIDVHTHLRGISSVQFGVDAAMCTLPFGVTAAADAAGGRGSADLLDAFPIRTRVFCAVPIRGNRADFTGTETALARYGAHTVGLKVYFDTAGGQVRDITPLAEICAYARGRGLRVMVHSTGSPVPMAEIVCALGCGDILSHTYHGGAHGASEDGFACLAAARQRGVWIDAGMAGHVHTDFAVLGEAIRCGFAPDLISTDITRLSAYVRGGRYGMTMCMGIARTLGMDEAAILRAVTSSPARALGMEAEAGTLAVGRPADIAVIADDGPGFDFTRLGPSPIRAARGYRCTLTLCGGEIMYGEI